MKTSEIDVDDRMILLAGAILVGYMLVSLIFTYRYRTGLSADEKSVQVYPFTDEVGKEKIRPKLEKEHLKIEKKKTKAEIKKAKNESFFFRNFIISFATCIYLGGEMGLQVNSN